MRSETTDLQDQRLASHLDTSVAVCYNCRMMQQQLMTRLEGVSDTMWRRFRALAVERGLTTPQLLGSVVNGYTIRASRRRMRMVIEPTTRRKAR